MATIYDVARKAGVSIGTVSRFLNENGYVGERTRERIKMAIEDLGFHPSSIARGLTQKRSSLLGFVVSDLLNPFVPEIVRSAQDLADAEGYCLLLYNTDGNGQREARALKLLYERRVDGLIIMSPETKEGNQSILDLQRLGIPTVLIGRTIKGMAFDRVTTDTYTGAIDAVMYLASLGHTRIAFIGGDTARGQALGRRRGYLDGLQKVGLPEDGRLLIETPLTRESGAEAMTRLLQLTHPPTGVFAANDISAIGAMQEVIRQGGKVPEDISIVGFDDIALAAQAYPPLTTIAQPKALLGQTAIGLLLARVKQEIERLPQEIRLSCELVVRGSTVKERGFMLEEKSTHTTRDPPPCIQQCW